MTIILANSVEPITTLIADEMTDVRNVTILDKTLLKGKIKNNHVYLINPDEFTQEELNQVFFTIADEKNVKFVLNTGFAGSIDYELSPMEVILSNEVVDYVSAKNYLSEDFYLKKFKQKYPSAKVGTVITVNFFIDSIEKKNEVISKAEGAKTIDMESSKVAKSASDANLPFVIERIVTDSANDTAKKNFVAYQQLASDKIADIIVESIKDL
jgi:adenosylhomocysteine nucleosidase